MAEYETYAVIVGTSVAAAVAVVVLYFSVGPKKKEKK